jgi:hypothetical protein
VNGRHSTRSASTGLIVALRRAGIQLEKRGYCDQQHHDAGHPTGVHGSEPSDAEHAGAEQHDGGERDRAGGTMSWRPASLRR